MDCVISNCVINLAPDKPAVFREIARVLKPGGRLAVSDIALKKPLPPEIGNDLTAYVGCIAGAILIEEYRDGLVEAGFAQVDIIDSGNDLNAYAKVENQSGCCSPAMGSSLPVVPASDCCSRSIRRRRPASTVGRPASPLQRERLCGQCPCLRREAGLTSESSEIPMNPENEDSFSSAPAIPAAARWPRAGHANSRAIPSSPIPLGSKRTA